jgi:hypothetical protein
MEATAIPGAGWRRVEVLPARGLGTEPLELRAPAMVAVEAWSRPDISDLVGDFQDTNRLI